MKKWIIVDVPYLCWRAFHKTGHLQFEGVGTGVLYGFFNTIKGQKLSVGANRIIFCFDLPPYKRKEIYPPYKSNRIVSDDPKKEHDRQEVKRQIELLRTDYLGRVGFHNVLFQKGYEADDVIASVVENLPENVKATIISNDKDLYQLLRKNVTMTNLQASRASQTLIKTRKWFQDEYGISPDQWHEVKAIAGCKTDNVGGIDGVGETIACAHLIGRTVTNRSKELITEFVKGAQYRINKDLVKLPYKGCKQFKIVKDDFDIKAFDKLMDSLGIKSLKIKDF